MKNARNKNRYAISTADMESDFRNEQVAKEKVTGLDTCCCLHLHSRRHRLTDADGASGKALIDGIVHSGLFKNDSPEYVKAVTYTQERIPSEQKEETILTISW